MRELAPGVRVLEPADYRRMRWKNGQGWTTEIAVHPAAAGLSGEPFDWRVSLAEIETDCGFSVFPGYDRSILLAEGAGMELSFDEGPSQRIAEKYSPLSFKGEWTTYCRLLDGPVRDFNIMSARGGWRHHCEIVRSASFAFPAESGLHTALAYCFRGTAAIADSKNLHVDMKPRETWLCSDTHMPSQLRIIPRGGDTVVAVVSVYARDGISSPMTALATGFDQ